MDLHLDETVSRLLSERALMTGRPEEQIVQEAVGLYLANPGYLAADVEDTAALADYERRKACGEITWVSAEEARALFAAAEDEG